MELVRSEAEVMEGKGIGCGKVKLGKEAKEGCLGVGARIPCEEACAFLSEEGVNCRGEVAKDVGGDFVGLMGQGVDDLGPEDEVVLLTILGSPREVGDVDVAHDTPRGVCGGAVCANGCSGIGENVFFAVGGVDVKTFKRSDRSDDHAAPTAQLKASSGTVAVAREVRCQYRRAPPDRKARLITGVVRLSLPNHKVKGNSRNANRYRRPQQTRRMQKVTGSMRIPRMPN